MPTMREPFRRRQADDETRRRFVAQFGELRAWVSRQIDRRLAAHRPEIRVAAASLPAVIVGGSVDMQIAWSSPMPSAEYNVDVRPSTALIGKATVTVKAGTKTAAGLTITVAASTALVAGGLVIVAAVH